jgi:hypothetical protein
MIPAGHIADLIFDGTRWQLINPATGAEVWFGQSTTAVGTANKETTIAGFTAGNLVAGQMVEVEFTVGNNSTTATLNISGTGAFGIRYHNFVPILIHIRAMYRCYFMYDGTFWQLLNPATGLSNSLPTIGLGFGTITTDNTTVAKVSTFAGFARSIGSLVWLHVRDTNTALNPTLNINTTGPALIQVDGANLDTIRRARMLGAGLRGFVWNGTAWQLINPAGIGIASGLPAPPTTSPVFDSNTWIQITAASNYIEQHGLTAEDIEEIFEWRVGDSKNVVVNAQTRALRILGFNHDNRTTGGKAGISLEIAPSMYNVNLAMNTTSTNDGGWESSNMRTTHMATILTQLPTDLRSAIKRVIKPTATSGNNPTLINSQDDLWLLSTSEVFGVNQSSAPGEGARYLFWTVNSTNASRIKHNPPGSAQWWWLRSPWAGGGYDFAVVDSGGGLAGDFADGARGVSFGLCV